MKSNKRILLPCGIVTSISICIYFLVQDKYLPNSTSHDFQQVNISTNKPEVLGETKTRDAIKSNVGLEDELSFLDGIKYKNIEFTDHGIQPKNLANVYDELVSKALDGDVGSARNLAFELYQCNFAYDSREALDGAIKRIDEEKVLAHPNLESDREYEVDVSRESAEMITLLVSELTEDYERCADITPSQRALSEVAKWAEIAADQGDFGAIKLLQLKAGRDSKEAVKWLNKSWEVFGDVDALSDMAIHYSMGINEDSRGQKEPDFEKAYAYNHAYKMIKEASITKFHSDYNDKVMSRFFDAVDQRAAYYGSQLGPAETLAAEAFANQLVRNNKNCCSSLKWW
ncbi:hypothetical protein [Arenicella xantha]|uniref:Uncharacterized protein n=1 Tax=Arenicella xantha TaxID=644221 RepID=A0A395JL79_9GAMM|nr:hypothetical protein [Arenicella xantha]RBP50597.1 hypothetical protein DFR28_1028 [Arenicella xantha]